MNFKLGNKKIAIFIIVIILLFITGGVFWWQEKEIERKREEYIKKQEEFEAWEEFAEWAEESEKTNREKIFASPEDYVIQETSEGKFIENKKDGLKVKVPNEWKVWKANDIMEDAGEMVMIFSLDFNPELSPPEGCRIEICIARNSESLLENAGLVRDYIARCQQNPEEMKNFGGEHYETIEIAGYQALKQIDLIESDKLVAMGIENHISVEIPIDSKVYFFNTLFGSQNSERCIKEFNEFIKNISIE